VLEPGRTLADHLDRLLLPGRLYRGDRDPEGLLSTVPAIGTALLGVLTGTWLRGPQDGWRKVRGMVAAGALCLLLGWFWSLAFPWNKNLWTSSFVLWTGGWSLLLLAAAYLWIDVLGHHAGTTFFVVLGANAITIYLLEAFVRWDAVVALVLDDAHLAPVVLALAGVGLRWLAMYALWRKRIFLRV
jgi:predicted acyltransferase